MIISFVIPCYGSEKTIDGVINEIQGKMMEKPEVKYEIITVNDCSPDNVLRELKGLAEKDPRIKILNLAKNSGKHAAMMAGYSVVNGDIIVNLDDDGQCPLDKLWELLEPLDNDYDVSIAHYPTKKQSALKNLGSQVNSLMERYMLGMPKDIRTSNFSAFKRFVVDDMISYKNPYPYIFGLVLRVTSKIANVRMEERERTDGIGNFTMRKSIALLINGFTAFSVMPLRIATVCGFVSAIIGIIFGIVTIIRKLLHPEILVGYSSMMAVLLFIGGMIMLLLGMIGEYIGRIYICINKSPQYVIREIINIDANNNYLKK